MSGAKPKRKHNLSPKALGLLIVGVLLLMVPYIVVHTGYSGKVLIAAEGTTPPFDKTLILIGRHNVDGAMGIILNKPLSESQRTKLSPFIRDAGIPVGYGGPLEATDRIFVMEEKNPAHPGETPILEISDWDEAVHATPGLLDKIRASIKNGEQRYRVFTGFANWGPLQLETETLLEHRWYAIPAEQDTVFHSNATPSWDVLELREKTKKEIRPDKS
jgi:putative transcriptional regulator